MNILKQSLPYKHITGIFVFVFIIVTLISGISACSPTDEINDNMYGETVLPTTFPTPTAESENTTAPVPSPTKESLQAYASIGVVGDIMIMQSQVKMASTDDGFDFTRSFEPMQGLFNSVDFMCGNLETPLAGEEASFSGPPPTIPPATENDPNPRKPYQTFNAPDELAYNLRDIGFDMLTTANNHCLDRGYEGLIRTLDILDDAGLYHTGTFRPEDTERYALVDINGINVGFIAYAGGFNEFNKELSESELSSISYLYDYDAIKASIASLRKAGAEFIIAFPHCGEELSHVPTETHRKLFRNMVEWGADAIIASHPHVVQPIEWIEVDREGVTINAPIVYSLGNFISNMFPAPKNYGIFVRLDIERDNNGRVFASDIGYTPVYCIRQKISEGILHQTLPCYNDVSKVTAYEPLSKEDIEELQTARDYVIDICGKEHILPVA